MINRLMKFKKTFAIYIVAALGIIFSSAFVQDFFEVSQQMDIFTSVYKEVNQFYVDEIKPGELMKKGITGMLKNLDPYTVYYPDAEIEDYRLTHSGGEYGGIGASSFRDGDSIVISDVYEGYAAQKLSSPACCAHRQHRSTLRWVELAPLARRIQRLALASIGRRACVRDQSNVPEAR